MEGDCKKEGLLSAPAAGEGRVQNGPIEDGEIRRSREQSVTL